MGYKDYYGNSLIPEHAHETNDIQRDGVKAMATSEFNGFMSKEDKLKLDNMSYKAYLIPGNTLNTAIRTLNINVTKIVFTKTAIPANKLSIATIVSETTSKVKIYMYGEDSIIYISPEYDNTIIFANSDSSNTFISLKSLTAIDFSNFNTSIATNMQSFISGCSKLTTFDMSRFDTSNVNNMSYWMRDCIGLISIDLSKFNTSKVTKMNSFASGCLNLKSLIHNFNTSSLLETSGMFSECKNLVTSLTLMNPNIGVAGNMFYQAATSRLAQITLKYINEETKATAIRLLSSKSFASNVMIDGFNVTVDNATWNAHYGDQIYGITKGTTVNIGGTIIGTSTVYKWDIYKVYAHYTNKTIVAEKVFPSKTNNTITIAEYNSTGLTDVDYKYWSDLGLSGHDTIAGYVTVSDTSRSGGTYTQMKTIYVGEEFARQYIPAEQL